MVAYRKEENSASQSPNSAEVYDLLVHNGFKDLANDYQRTIEQKGMPYANEALSGNILRKISKQRSRTKKEKYIALSATLAGAGIGASAYLMQPISDMSKCSDLKQEYRRAITLADRFYDIPGVTSSNVENTADVSASLALGLLGAAVSRYVAKTGIAITNGVRKIIGRRNERKDLTSRLSSTTAIISLIGGTFFLSSNVTGNAISNLSNTTSSWIGGVLILIGIVALGFWIANRKK